MTDSTDLQIIDEIIKHVPHWTWPFIRDRFAEIFVDNMTSDVLLRLTGERDNFDRAEELVLNHYSMPGYERQLLIDATQVITIEEIVYQLDAMQLDKLDQPIDTAPCSVEPQ